jgi:hypothetical protein
LYQQCADSDSACVHRLLSALLECHCMLLACLQHYECISL